MFRLYSDLFFELLQIAQGNRDKLSRVPTRKEWMALYQKSENQSILGIMLGGLELLPDEQSPPQDILLQWIGFVHMIEQNTIAMAKASSEAVDYFRGKGFASTLLKGVAVGRFYPNSERRQSGDIDVWLDGGRIYDYARTFDKEGKLYGVNYQHIHFHPFDDIPLEVHVWPACLSNPLHNRRFHQFCAIHHPIMEQSMPSLAFDRVFILMHCYNHMTGNGVGLRQIMDYYFVLKQGFTKE